MTRQAALFERLTNTCYATADFSVLIEQTPLHRWVVYDFGKSAKVFDSLDEAREWAERWVKGEVIA